MLSSAEVVVLIIMEAVRCSFEGSTDNSTRHEKVTCSMEDIPMGKERHSYSELLLYHANVLSF